MAILFQNNGNATAHALANEAVINATAVFHKIDVQAKGARGVAPLTHVRHILQQEQVGDDQQGCSAFAPGGKGAAGVYYWEYLAGWATVLPHETERTVWAEEDSENHDSSRRVARYFGAQTLAQDPEYAQRVLPNGKSVTEERDAWEAWWYAWPVGVHEHHVRWRQRTTKPEPEPGPNPTLPAVRPSRSAPGLRCGQRQLELLPGRLLLLLRRDVSKNTSTAPPLAQFSAGVGDRPSALRWAAPSPFWQRIRGRL